jgi:hypothetical protein
LVNPPGIDLDEEYQKTTLESLAVFYGDLPFVEHRTAAWRYYFGQPAFCHADAIYLYGMLRKCAPKRVIEVGCGYSSAVGLDTTETFLGGSTHYTFIEPYPDVLNDLLRPNDLTRHRLIAQPVQDVPLSIYDDLGDGDILFIDTSHVTKVGSDVNHLFFNVMPRLRPGVLVHIHDIFYPFDYPAEWYAEGRAWNEAFLTRAFLQHNDTYRIMLYASFAGWRFEPWLREHMPLCLRNTGGSLWLKKCR